MGLLQNFKNILKIAWGNMYVINDELDHFVEKLLKIIQIFLLKSSDSDPDLTLPKSSGSDRIWIHNTGQELTLF
jgi:hypothetical protein